MCSKPSKSRMSLKQTKQIIGAAALSSRCGAQIEAAHCLPGISSELLLFHTSSSTLCTRY